MFLQHQQFVASLPPPPPPAPQYVHSDYTATPARTDGFHVYRTTQGNYLKVFYNNEDGMNYNNYELFPNSTFIPHHMIQPQPQQTPPHSNQTNPEQFYHMPDTSNTNFINQLVTSEFGGL